ncbi:MAG: glycosyltransferase [Clostridiales bacterium]|nr:glycosyltransferase [Clostridiales bacterium]
MQLIFDLIKYQGQLPIPNAMYGFIYFFTNITGLLFMLMYFHQFIYLIIGTLRHTKVKDKVFKFHTIGIVISARNESKVIANLINSIRANDYPQAMIRIFVIADNCTDNTAQICRDLGCIVFERNDTTKIGKGYALNYMFTKLHTESQYADLIPEAYLILDADNIIKPNFITEMNKVYDSGYDMVTSYRNTKNFGKNWITSGYGYWFLHEARHLNNARMMMKTCCAISGTGFLISQAVVKEFGNWSFFTLTEDIQCSTTYAITGRRVAYCGTAELYDEQPETFKQSWRQRERWAKGLYQVLGLQGKNLIKNTFTKFACWDILTTCIPALIISCLTLITLPICAIVGFCMGSVTVGLFALQSLLMSIVQMLSLMFLIGILICITEWKKIKCPAYKKILYLFTFPLFMATYIPIAVSAMFKKVEWKPIVHTADVSIEELEGKSENKK